jgi:hypothetical protein
MNTYDEGQRVFSEGDSSNFVGYILQGEAEVVKNHGDGFITIGQLKAGEYFGEMAAIEGRNHGASVRATSALTVDLIERHSFLERVSQDSVLAFELLQRLSRRLHSLDDAYAAVVGGEEGDQLNTIQEKLATVRILPGSETIASIVPATGLVINHFPFVVGRTPSFDEQRPIGGVDLCLDNVMPYRLSRAHFAIQWLGEKIIIRDLNSHLGTKVNDTYIGHYAPRDIAELHSGENLIVAGGDDSPFTLKVVVSE